jgi:hypothetical protein
MTQKYPTETFKEKTYDAWNYRAYLGVFSDGSIVSKVYLDTLVLG